MNSLMNSNPVLVATHIQYHAEVYLKKTAIVGSLGKKYHAVSIEFEIRGSSHIHYFLWIINPLLRIVVKWSGKL